MATIYDNNAKRGIAKKRKTAVRALEQLYRRTDKLEALVARMAQEIEDLKETNK